MTDSDSKTLVVLVVEDDDVNRFVIATKVERLGYLVKQVSNGQQALCAVQAGGIDAVLMDCQMPVMDGYTATREIRKLAGAPSRVPILALTAHGHASERERVLSVGMDDYLTKPVRDAALQAALARQLSRTSRARSPADPADPAPSQAASSSGASQPAGQSASPEPSDSRATLPELDARSGRSQKVIELCLRLWPIELQALGAAFESGDLSTLRARAHKLKGSAGSVGALRLAAAAEALLRVPEGNPAQLSSAFTWLLSCSVAACARLRGELAQASAT